MSTDSTKEPEITDPARRLRWWPGVAILLFAVAAQCYFLNRFAEDSTFAKFSFLWVWPATLFAMFLWWTFGSGLRWRTRFQGLSVCLAAVIVFFSVFRIDGSDGDMVPKLSYRWTPRAEDVARKYWKQQLSIAEKPVEQVSADTTSATDVSQVEPLVAGVDDWPDFRGPQRDGVIRGTGYRTNWNERPPQELWRHPVGPGWSSFSILGDIAITMEQRDDQESVVCYDLATGDQRWVHGDNTRFAAVEVNGGDGPHATPVIAGDQTYSLGATGILNCLETRTGSRIWSRNILEDAEVTNLEWGVSGSPLVIDDLVIVLPGGMAGKAVIAYQRTTGDISWSAGNFIGSYAGARVEEYRGVRHLLAFHGTGIASFDVHDGRALWEFPLVNMPKVNAAQPIKLDDHSLMIGTGYGVGSVRLSLTSTDDDWTVEEAWKTNRLKLKFNDAVLLNGYLFGLDDGVLTCLDPETGKTKWKARGFGYGQILGFDKSLVAVTEEGDVVLVAAEPTRFEELGRFHALDGTTWNHPAVAHGKFLVRNGSMAACYDVAP